MSDFETINTTNGNLMLRFSLGSLAPGRGGLTGSMGLRYNSKLFDSDVGVLTDYSNHLTAQNYLTISYTGGWKQTSSLDYSLNIINRNNLQGGPYECSPEGGTDNYRAVYIWKVKLVYPDGGEHEFRPTGYSDILGDGYFNVDPTTGEIRDVAANGYSCTVGITGQAANPLSYFSTDGTYTRLTINRGVGWTLSFPDGTRVVSNNASLQYSAAQYLYDRNNNYITYGSVTLPNSHVVQGIVDQFGHYVAMESNVSAREDYYYSLGFNNQSLMWTVKWKGIAVLKPYETTAVEMGRYRGTTSDQTFHGGFAVVDRITLPSQAGDLSYQFSYNGVDSDPNSPPTSATNGWGELSGVTLPSGAQTSYQYERDSTHAVDEDHPVRASVRQVLDNAISAKTLTYQAEYDGTSTSITENWVYQIGTFVSTIVGSDGGITIEYHNDTASPQPDAGLVSFQQFPNGETIERGWQPNNPPTLSGFLGNQSNFYVKRELHSIPNAAGTLVWTAIKDYEYDKNGNVTREKDYDWAPYSSVHGSGGVQFVSGLTPMRILTTSYNNPTVSADDHTSEQSNAYWNLSAPAIRTLPAASEIQGIVGQSTITFARSEFGYDNTSTTGNLIRKTSWDSSKGVYSNPLCTDQSLCTVNSVSNLTDYNQYGSPTTITDPRGNQTRITYGSIGSVTDLYPTQTQTAYGTSVQRTETRTYDLSTGLVTSVTDADNAVTSSMTYDSLGRPTLVKAADGKSEETRTRTAYDDTLRRVIVYSDLNTLGDEKLVAIQHYDQLGRIRLSRQLEDSTTQSATDETTGIKVQTRYLVNGSNSYVLSSNPYRASTSGGASGEGTMGWTRSKSDNTGRMIEMQTFSGSGLPAPWGSNSTNTGTVTTAYDANFTTVTDQAGKLRRSMTNGLGQLVRVDEPDGNGNLDVSGSPAQPTSYDYDVLGNLLHVYQGSQTRTFTYSSLARLLTATNPESGTLSYTYDANGNLLAKTDARSIVSTYAYDALNRATTRSYSDSTPTVTYTYDTVSAYGKGRLASVSSSVSSYSYSAYNALGRALGGTQTISGHDYSITNVAYDRAGHVTAMTYPSGHSVTFNYDTAGRLGDKDSSHLAFAGNLGSGGNPRTYSSIAGTNAYDPAGHLTQEQFGTTPTAVYNKLAYNSRGQLAEIRAGTASVDDNRGKIVNDYGTTGNNGNLQKQTVYIPNIDQNASPTSWYQLYDYDSLNRLGKVREYNSSNTQLWQQAYTYDRYGNRTIDVANTTDGIPKPYFAVDTTNNNNRLVVPSGYSGTMHYDAAGNLDIDTYSAAAVSRLYDAENRMTRETQASSYVAGEYSYDGDGHRVKRRVGSVETWQVYGLGGELIAEYAQNGSASTLQKEYGYRNGQLLVTATATTGWGAAPTIHDNPLVANQTTVQALHITELRDAINALRSHMSLSNYPWQCSATTNDYISANPILEMRTAVDQALGAPSDGYAAGLAPGQPVKAIHIQELRDRVLTAWQNGSSVDLRWMVTDQLGTPRMIFDQSGSLANASRHDYLPFGEEVPANFRTGIPGYSTNDSVRQKFTQKERDNETGLDYFLARYYSSTQGRLTSPDAPFADQFANNPQSWNLYAYVRNNPLVMIDPTGRFGDYYDQNGKWLKNDDKKDDKVYVVLQAPLGLPPITIDLGITHTQFKIIANIVRHEAGTADPEEARWIAHTANNEASATHVSVYDLLQSSFSSAGDDIKANGIATTDSSDRANAARAGVSTVFAGGPDPTGGARRWDGTDFLAWGLHGPYGEHAKFRQFTTIDIPGDIYNTYETAQVARWGHSITYSGTRYNIPAAVFTDRANWTAEGNFHYATGARRATQGLTATGAKGQTIFWRMN